MLNINALRNCNLIVENVNEQLDAALYPLYTLKIKIKETGDAGIYVNVLDASGANTWVDISTGIPGISIHYKGSCEYANLPKSGRLEGDMWNISGDFDIEDKHYIDGSNVIWDGYKWDVLSGSNIEEKKNKITSFSEDVTDEQYASAKAIYDELVKAVSNVTVLDKISTKTLTPNELTTKTADDPAVLKSALNDVDITIETEEVSDNGVFWKSINNNDGTYSLKDYTAGRAVYLGSLAGIDINNYTGNITATLVSTDSDNNNYGLQQSAIVSNAPAHDSLAKTTTLKGNIYTGYDILLNTNTQDNKIDLYYYSATKNYKKYSGSLTNKVEITDSVFYDNLKLFLNIDDSLNFDTTDGGTLVDIDHISNVNCLILDDESAIISVGDLTSADIDFEWNGSDFVQSRTLFTDKDDNELFDTSSVDSCEKKSNKVTELNGSVSDDQYPSAAAIVSYVKKQVPDNITLYDNNLTGVFIGDLEYASLSSSTYPMKKVATIAKDFSEPYNFKITVLTTDNNNKKYGAQYDITYTSNGGYSLNSIKGNLYYSDSSSNLGLVFTTDNGPYADKSIFIFAGSNNAIATKSIKLADGTTLTDSVAYDNLKIYIDGESDSDIIMCESPETETRSMNANYIVLQYYNSDTTWDGSDYINDKTILVLKNKNNNKLAQVVGNVNDNPTDLEIPNSNAVKNYVSSLNYATYVSGSNGFYIGDLQPSNCTSESPWKYYANFTTNISNQGPAGNFTLTVLTKDSNGKKYGAQFDISVNGTSGWTLNSAKGNLYYETNNEYSLGLGITSNYSDFSKGYAPVYIGEMAKPSTSIEHGEISNKKILLADGTTYLTDPVAFDNLTLYIDSSDLGVVYKDEITSVSYGWSATSLTSVANSDTTWDGSDFIIPRSIQVNGETAELLTDEITEDSTKDEFPNSPAIVSYVKKSINDLNFLHYEEKADGCYLADIYTGGTSTVNGAKLFAYIDRDENNEYEFDLLIRTVDSNGKYYGLYLTGVSNDSDTNFWHITDVKGNFDISSASMYKGVGSMMIGIQNNTVSPSGIIISDSGYSCFKNKSIALTDGTYLTDSVAFDNIKIYVTNVTKGKVTVVKDPEVTTISAIQYGVYNNIGNYTNSDTTYDVSNVILNSNSIIAESDGTERMKLVTKIESDSAEDEYANVPAVKDYVGDLIFDKVKLKENNCFNICNIVSNSDTGKAQTFYHIADVYSEGVINLTVTTTDITGKKYGAQFALKVQNVPSASIAISSIKGNLFYNYDSSVTRSTDALTFGYVASYDNTTGALKLYLGEATSHAEIANKKILLADCTYLTDREAFKNLRLYVDGNDDLVFYNDITDIFPNSGVYGNSILSTNNDVTWDGSDFIESKQGNELLNNTDIVVMHLSDEITDDTKANEYPNSNAVKAYIDSLNHTSYVAGDRWFYIGNLKGFDSSLHLNYYADFTPCTSSGPQGSFIITVLTTDSTGKKYGVQYDISVNDSGWTLNSVKGNLYYASGAESLALGISSNRNSFAQGYLPIYIGEYCGHEEISSKKILLADGVTYLTDPVAFNNLKLYINSDDFDITYKDTIVEATPNWVLGNLNEVANSDTTWDGSDFEIIPTKIQVNGNTVEVLTDVITDDAKANEYPNSNAVKAYVDSRIPTDSIMIYKGEVTFANLPTENNSKGDAYKITDSFTVDSLTYPSGILCVYAGDDNWTYFGTPIDNTPTKNSNNLITSAAVYAAIENLKKLIPTS